MKTISLQWLLILLLNSGSVTGLTAYAGNQAATNNQSKQNQQKVIWQEQFDNTPKNWTEAAAYCQSLNSEKPFSWRLPSILEIKALVKSTERMQIDTRNNPLDMKQLKYWSQRQDKNYTDCAWCVDIVNGFVSLEKQTQLAPARCVAETY